MSASRALRAAPFAAWCAATWTASSSSRPLGDLELPFEGADKVVHASIFAAGGVAGWWMLAGFGRPRAAVHAVLCCVAWGVLDEIHQSFVPGRSADPWDAAADALGAAVGAIAAESLLRRRLERPSR